MIAVSEEEAVPYLRVGIVELAIKPMKSVFSTAGCSGSQNLDEIPLVPTCADEFASQGNGDEVALEIAVAIPRQSEKKRGVESKRFPDDALITSANENRSKERKRGFTNESSKETDVQKGLFLEVQGLDTCGARYYFISNLTVH